ncbi:hypothetical protein vseg_011689 [Gypsophila vaccaria]
MLVEPKQAAFVKHRDIFDNIQLAAELARKYTRRTISPWCVLKVDIRKVFDSVNWTFLQNLLKYYGFPDRFIVWIMQCISTAHFSLSINGRVESYFAGKRGLRQGDPLSPYLFGLCMEFLSRMLTTLPLPNDFTYQPKCNRVSLTHLVLHMTSYSFPEGT